ncbi:hypothetical protein GCM10009754_08600 [Amycolatopsis minnesotensis]|uniref:DEAD/DEAH box helicase n=2 Tax=Amycolatopsis minnesotensis TaxID=337894 RepID=A0ABN2Q6D4_9PSEU
MGYRDAMPSPAPTPAAGGEATGVLWAKITDPDADLPGFAPGDDVRVLLPDDERFTVLGEKLLANGVDGAAVRRVRYLLEDETVRGSSPARLTVDTAECHLGKSVPRQFPRVTGSGAEAARDAFDALWQAHVPPEGVSPVPAADVLPPDWLRFLPYPELNPAQAVTVPEVLAHDDHLVIVAPTGAGKTVMGMTAALKAVLAQGRKAAWLVPQRSLTDELNRELDQWREQGLRVERLSGEYSVDIQRVREADLWVATTEKFEAICRASSLREALTEVGCLIVDEIHLLGDPARGPVLEALLARMRGEDARMRIVGLSATVSNADQVAAWLGAKLLRVAWRPTKLTWQLPTIAAHRDWGLVETARIRLASSITRTVTRDGGSVLVFCGSKRNVRRTALIIAAALGAATDGVHPDDLDRLHEVCRSARVGLHYKGWEHKRQSEVDFRARELDVLVATSTVAAGVNLPARAVVIQDTEVGLNPIDVATVQQMFGRAGRIGAGEREGWAFLIVTENERAAWQAKLVAGHTVRSQIESSLADHVLAEAVQGRISSLAEAERWWVGTFACHQGSRSLAPLRRAIDFLTEAGFLAAASDDADRVVATELGLLTARLMVSATVGHEIRLALADTELPDGPEAAEAALIDLVSTVVPKLAGTAISEELKPVVARALRPGGGDYQRGDLARMALRLVASNPDAFRRGARVIDGIPYVALYPALEEAPRYLHWLGCQGLLGTVHPWGAIVAADLGRRVRWRRCRPRRGAGRLLWMCEQLATPPHAEDLVPELFAAATERGLTSPDWTVGVRPRGTVLDEQSYPALLRERASAAEIGHDGGVVTASGPEGSVLGTWLGKRYRRDAVPKGGVRVALPAGELGEPGAALFTWRGDHRATGWLARYSALAPGNAR